MGFHRNSMCKQSQLKPFVYALFTQTKKKALAISRKCLISNVDQPGLEPGTSRSMRLEGPNGVTSPFPAGRYEVELYLKTEELDEHFVMRRTLDVR